MSAGKSIKRSAHASALEQLDLGIWLLRSNDVADADEREIEFQLARGVALMAARGWGSTEVLAAFERAEELCGKIGDQARLFTALRGRAQYYMLSGKPAAAQELANRWTGMVKDDSDPGLAIETEHMFWTNNFFLGETSAAHAHAERAIGLYDAGPRSSPDLQIFRSRSRRLLPLLRGIVGLARRRAGHGAAALRRCDRACRALAASADLPLLPIGGRAYLHMFAGEPEAALEAAESELQIAEKFQLPLIVGQAAFQIGWARVPARRARARPAAHGGSHIRNSPDRRGNGAALSRRAYTPKRWPTAADWTRRRSRSKPPSTSAATTEPTSSSPKLLRIEARIRERSGGGSDEIEQMLHKAANVATLQRSAIGRLRVAVELARRLQKRGDPDRRANSSGAAR